MPSLTKVDKDKGRVVLAVTVTALLLQRACKAVGIADDNMPAVQQCTLLLSELLDPLPVETRNAILRTVNRKRVLLTGNTKDLDMLSALVAAIEVLAGKKSKFKSRPGTRFDFIRQTLRENLPVFIQMAPIKEKDQRLFDAQFRISLQ